ncbi:Hypothetical predicted protein [Olea europaea subsp. europaea]|uniref:Uncharacterized protein n=1 Tax=Olea europaea subsp. europaea TaxID=158383 RepID=A0A8S0PXG5_OLEEU|nr:Hypothetical predicted protein [Olea europaea subsp. europaea]
MMETNRTNSNVLSPYTTQTSFQCGALEDTASGNIRDPECVKRKGAPKKLRKKSPLETISSKVKQVRVLPNGRKRRFLEVIWEWLQRPFSSRLNNYTCRYRSPIRTSFWLAFVNHLISMIMWYLLIMLFHAGWEPKSSFHTTLGIHVSKPFIGNNSYIKYARFGNAF